MTRNAVQELTSNHQEADTKIIVHVTAATAPDHNIVIRATDIDIAVLLIYHSEKISGTLWMDDVGKKRKKKTDISLTSLPYP